MNRYLSAFYVGDFEGARLLVNESFSFEGPFLSVDGRDAFFEGAEGLKAIVRGHRVLRQWEEDDEVSTVYELDLETPVGSGTVPMAEWHRVEDGQLVFSRVLFDSVAFRALMPTAKDVA